jgi:hypothetical protein
MIYSYTRTMQRKVFQGVPYWVDSSQKIYAYDPKETTGTLWLGTVKDEKVTLRDDWQSVYQPALVQYRAVNGTRPRVAAPAK